MQTNGSASLLVDANGRVGLARSGALTNSLATFYTYAQQLTADSDGQAVTYAYRTRNSQNDGTGYGLFTSNSASLGYNHWGDLYTFGTTGFSDNDNTRTGGVLGAYSAGTYWGALGYRSSALVTYAVYGSAAYATGAGRATATGAAPATEGIGLGIYGGAMGGWVRGEALGLVSRARYSRPTTWATSTPAAGRPSW